MVHKLLPKAGKGLTNVQNANIKNSSWLFKENKMHVFSNNNKKKMVWEMKLQFIKKKESNSDLRVAVSKLTKLF